jgi:hypothetical protein
MATMPNQAEYASRLFALQAGKRVTLDHLQRTIPENTSILVVALVVDQGTEDAVLTAIRAQSGVNIGLEVGRQRTPAWTPQDQEWEARVTFVGGHRMIPG